MKWNKVKEIAPLHVIGALDEKTAHEVESSLHGATPDKQGVIARWRDVAALLPHALPLQTPPVHLRERLLNRIAEESQQAPIEIAVEEATLKEMADRGEKNVLPFFQPRRAESRAALAVDRSHGAAGLHLRLPVHTERQTRPRTGQPLA
jgi:hypothetical protein